VRRALAVMALVLAAALAGAVGTAVAEKAPAGQGPVWVIEMAETVNPGSADYLADGLERAARDDAVCAIIVLDTPGGLVESMRAMVKAILAAPMPVVVYVAPSGARAASAGAFLVMAAPMAAMAPATNLGAAHPVAAGGKEIEGAMADKAVADLTAMMKSLAQRRGRPVEPAAAMVTESASYSAEKAKELGLVEEVAPELGDLLGALEGKTAATAAGPRAIAAAGKALHFHQPGLRHRLLSLLASPNLAYLLMMIGLMGLYFELSNPGAVLPGVVGGLALILALFAMSALPVSYTGLALIGLSVVLFITEIYVTSYGLLSLAGAASLILGSLMLFDSDSELFRVSLAVMLPVVAGVLAFFLTVTWLAMRAQLRKASTGHEGLVGMKAVAAGPAKVRVMGELWHAAAPRELAPGEEVVITKVEGLKLTVEPEGD